VGSWIGLKVIFKTLELHMTTEMSHVGMLFLFRNAHRIK
jgi:hypothetical protein